MNHPCDASDGTVRSTTAVVDREAWLLRRVLAESYPLRHLLRLGRPEELTATIVNEAGALRSGTPPMMSTPPLGARNAAVLDDGEVARRIQELPPLPRALTEALRVLRSDNLAADACVSAIEQDATLAARVLRLANSPFYGACGRVSSVADAVRLLGLRTVASVVAAVSMRTMLASWSDDGALLQSYWRHALATATAARELAPIAGANADEAFLGGLLHDLGRLVIAVFAPESAQMVRAQVLAEDIDTRDAETRHVGRSHDEIGAAVARRWMLPEPIVAAIALHHRPFTANEPSSAALAAVVHIADAIAHAMDLTGDPNEAAPPIDGAAWCLAGPCDDLMPTLVAKVSTTLALMALDH